MPDMTSPDAQVAPDELVDTVLAASRALVAVAARSLAAAGDEVTLPQYRALVVLAARGPQGTAELAAALAVNPSTATRMCDRLVRKGLIRRHRQPGDRRAIRIALTAPGRDLVAEVSRAAPGRAGPAARGPAAGGARAGHRGVPRLRGRGRRASAARGRARLGRAVTRSHQPGSARLTIRQERRAWRLPAFHHLARRAVPPIACQPGPARRGSSGQAIHLRTPGQILQRPIVA